MVTASSSLSSFICYCLSSDFHIHLAKLLTGGASSPGNGQAVPRKGELWTNAPSLTRKSSPVSVSSAEPKKCQSVWPVFQFKSSQRANELQDDALSLPDKNQALIMINKEREGSWQLALFSCHLFRFV